MTVEAWFVLPYLAHPYIFAGLPTVMNSLHINFYVHNLHNFMNINMNYKKEKILQLFNSKSWQFYITASSPFYTLQGANIPI